MVAAWNTWPSSRTSDITTWSLPKSCWHALPIASNTGAASATELLMTLSTSAVAVCCSSASCVSLNSRTFSIAITAWSANDPQSDLLVAEGARRMARQTPSAPMPRLAQTSGSNNDALIPDRLVNALLVRTGSSMARPVGDVQHGLAERCTRDGSWRRDRSASTVRTAAGRTPVRGGSVRPAQSVLPSERSSAAQSQAEQSDGAAPTMASNTGCTSVGELLMTRRMSALAVWRASASCVSLNSRAFWMAITAWSAKVLTRISSDSEKSRGGVQMMSIVPMPRRSTSLVRSRPRSRRVGVRPP